MISMDTIIELNSWRIDNLTDLETEEEWFVLRRIFDDGSRLSIPFDEVRASGGLIELNYQGSRSGVFRGILDGRNRYYAGSELPKRIVDTLKDIGPW